MAVSNGQNANETVFNAAFVSKTVNSDMAGVLGLKNAGSGADVTNVQSQINTNITNISTNTSDITAHDGRITSLENKTDNLVESGSRDASAALQINSTTKGTLFPRMDTTQRDAISSPATGLEIYNTDTKSKQFYNGTVWADIGKSGLSAGAGANWLSNAGGPIENFENGDKVFLYDSALGQPLDLFLKVPSEYVAGVQISVFLNFYSPSTTNNFKFQLVSTLVRKNTDAVDSTTNQNTVNTGDIVNPATANQLREASLDLTDVNGQINAVGVSPGDMIKLSLERIAATGSEDTDDVRFIPNATEFVFI